MDRGMYASSQSSIVEEVTRGMCGSMYLYMQSIQYPPSCMHTSTAHHHAMLCMCYAMLYTTAYVCMLLQHHCAKECISTSLHHYTNTNDGVCGRMCTYCVSMILRGTLTNKGCKGVRYYYHTRDLHAPITTIMHGITTCSPLCGGMRYHTSVDPLLGALEKRKTFR